MKREIDPGSLVLCTVVPFEDGGNPGIHLPKMGMILRAVYKDFTTFYDVLVPHYDGRVCRIHQMCVQSVLEEGTI